MGRLLRRLRYWLGQKDHEAALAEEIELHRALKQQELEGTGLPSDDARFAVGRAMGNVTFAREESRAQWIWPWLESVWQDLRIAVRALRRQPGFTLLSVIVLGVAIGLNTSLFTVFAGAALRPMSGVTDPDRLALVSARAPGVPNLLTGLSLPEFRFLAARSTAAELAAERRTSVTLDAGTGRRETTALFVTGNYFQLLGARLPLGRGVLPADDTRGSPAAVVVLSHVLWQTQFGGDPSVLGRSIRITGQPHTVIGIVAPDFGAAPRARVWLPMSALPVLRPDDHGFDRPEVCCAEVYARLRQGLTRTQLQVQLDALSNRFRASAGQDARPVVVGGTQAARGRRGDDTTLAAFRVLFLGMTMVLLLACANVGNLLLARAAGRRNEIAMRLSLGAGRRRIVRQLLTEGMLLTVIAAGAGLGLAAWLPHVVLNVLVGEAAPFDIDLDGPVFVYAAVLAVVACVTAALAPALHATRGAIAASLKGAVAAVRLPLRSVLLAAQVAITVVLLASAGLLLRGVAAARDMDLGFRIDDIDEASIRLPQPEYNAERMRVLVPELSQALDSAGFTAVALAAPGRSTGEARVPGPDNQSRPVDRFDVSPSYFDVLDIPIVAGRRLIDGDRDRGLVVVNETLARLLWGGEEAVGRAFVVDDRPLEVIGVVRDAKLLGLGPPPPIYFAPLTGPRGALFPTVLVRRRQSADTAGLSQLIRRLEPRAEVTWAPMRDRIDFELEALRLAPLAASVLGLFALGLATVGMFGVFAYSVRQRSRDIGIRLALGARSRDVIAGVLATSARAVVYGLGAGVLAAAGASQLLRRSLYGVSPLDPVTYAGVALIIAAAAMVASYAPARRAVEVNPVSLLREE